nr:MAG TPA: hypothetical protein [Caudoviricetes sp.]
MKIVRFIRWIRFILTIEPLGGTKRLIIPLHLCSPLCFPAVRCHSLAAGF